MTAALHRMLAPLLLALVACYWDGESGDAPQDGDAQVDPRNLPPNPGAAPLRRLTNTEYDNTVADLLGDTSALGKTFPGATTSKQGYDSYASGLGVSTTHAENFLTAAETLATKAIADLPKLLQCDVAAKGEAACTQAFIRSFGERAFRRPLTQAEVDRFTAFATSMAAGRAHKEVVRLVLEAFLSSPAFLYRVEYALPGKAGDFIKPTSWEMASRLSYLFLATMPDAELSRAARADELADPANIEKHARRLLADPRAKLTFSRFADQWLEIRYVDSIQKSAAAVADWQPLMRPLMREEASRLIDSVAWGGGDARALFSADYTFLNGPLAAFYGVSGVSGDAFMKVRVNPSQRMGILTMPAVLAVQAQASDTAPARRGKFVRTKVFCLEVGDPPPGANAMAPVRTPSMTERDYFAAIGAQPSCGACHRGLNGAGFGLEAYDPSGRFRTTDMGRPVDASGELVDTDVDGPFVGGVELAAKAAKSKMASACMAKQMFRFATGRPDSTEDAHSLAKLAEDFAAGGNRIPELFVSLTRTDAFLLKPSLGGTP
jgi:hypothetical protein